MSPLPNAEAVQKALDAAQQAGVKLFITCPELKTDPEGTVKRFMNHPALEGYHLIDEPNAKLFPELAAWVKKIQAVDANHPCYINLFPNYATAEQLGNPTYQAHVDSFIATVPIPTLSFDHYPVMIDSIRSNYYENLEIFSDAARKAGKPFWAFAIDSPLRSFGYPDPTPASLRFQIYSDLAYGAQGIQYYTYWSPPEHHAPIDSSGARTVNYNYVKDVNAEIQKVAGVFMGSKVVSVGHIGASIPRGTKMFEPFPPFREVKVSGQGVAVSHLEKGDAGFLVVVNRDIVNSADLQITLDSGANAGAVGKDGAVTPISVKDYRGKVDPGGAAIFMWKKK